MPAPGDRKRPAGPPASVDELLKKLAATPDRHAQHRLVGELARAAVVAKRVPAVFQQLAHAGTDGPRLALEFASRLPDPLPVDLMRAALPFLANKATPTPVRVLVAGKMLSALPDGPKTVTPVVRAVAGGLPRSRMLERMLQLQSRVEKCVTLDRMIEAAAHKVHLKCPKCPARLGRQDFISHLWHKHRLVYDQHKAHDARPLVEEAINAAAVATTPALIDQSYLTSAHYYPDADPVLTFQALAARGDGDPTQTDRLVERAAADHAGLCPVCLSAVPDPIPPLPPPASLAGGRLAADGYSVDVADTRLGRVVTIASPGAATEIAADSGRRMPPRLYASFAGLIGFAIAVVAVLAVPESKASPLAVAGLLTAVAFFIYLCVRFLRKPLADPTDRAVDVAWSSLAPGIGRSPEAIRFLTRLCRASIGAGSATNRGTAVFEVVEHSAVLADKGGAFVQLLATARVLQVLDAARMGKEKVSGLVGVFEPFLRGELSAVYAETASEVLLAGEATSAGDLGRLGVSVVGLAFDYGLNPMDLVTVGRFCPQFRRVIFDARPDHLGQLYAVWRGRNSQPWDTVGRATTVFELAKESPAAGRRLLADEPDALLRLDFNPATEAVLGTVVLTSHGVSVGGYAVADPDAIIALVKSGSGWRLQFGPHRLALEKKPPSEIADELHAWVRYRAEKLLPLAERQERRGPGPKAVGMLAPLAIDCPLCSTRSVLRTGRLGTPWQAIAGAGR